MSQLCFTEAVLAQIWRQDTYWPDTIKICEKKNYKMEAVMVWSWENSFHKRISGL